MNKVPVIAFKHKNKEGRYLAADPDFGDWNDPDLDVTIDDIGGAMLIWSKDKSKPPYQAIEELKLRSEEHKKRMRAMAGEHAVISFDVEKWLEIYEPVHIEITQEAFDQAVGYAFG